MIWLKENWLFKEKKVKRFLTPYHLTLPLSIQYIDKSIHNNLIDLNFELKVFGKYGVYVELIQTKNIFKQMANKYCEHFRQFNFKINVHAYVKYKKIKEEILEETINNFVPAGMIINITRKEWRELDVKTKLDNVFPWREIEGSGWKLQGINYLKKYFIKTLALNGRTYVKFLTRTNSILNNQNNDTNCLLWSILASVYPIGKNPQRVGKNITYQNELKLFNKDFRNRMRKFDMPWFESLNSTLSINVFEYSTDEKDDYETAPSHVPKILKNAE